MEVSCLFFMVLGLVTWEGMLAQTTCPSTVPECYCRRKYLARDYLICRNLHVDRLPPFLKDQNTIYSEIEIHCDSRVSTLHADVFVNITADLLTLHSVSLRHLEKGAFNVLDENLMSLDLEGNLLTEIPEGVFVSFSKLEYLNLAYNKLSHITSDPFGELSTVTSLHLEHNVITDIDAKAFLRLGSIQTLDLSHNLITQLQAGTFYGRNNLRYIYLNNNFISELPIYIFFDLMNLLEINIAHNNLTRIEIETFDDLMALQKLDLSHNRIDFNNFATTFTSVYLEIPYLLILDVSHNDVSRLSRYYFMGLQSLEELYLQGNRLQEIPSRCFYYLSKMKILDLSWNQIDRIQRDSFDNLYSLEVVKLDHNKLETIPDGTFSQLFQLQSIYLGNNSLRRLGRQNFAASSSLRSLHFENNEITQITMDTFASTSFISLLMFTKLADIQPEGLQDSGVTLIDFTNNSLSHIDDATFFEYRLLEKLKLGNNMLRRLNKTMTLGLLQLKSLELQNNQLGQLTFAPFKEMNKLRYLGLQNNEIPALESDTLSGLQSLQQLNISRNKIKDVSENSMNDLRSLTKLDASKNKLTSLPTQTFRNLLMLESLNLAGNELQTFTEDYSRDLLSLERLNIASNKLHCNCNLAWLRIPKNLPKVDQLQETRCETPDQFLGYPVMCFPVHTCFNVTGIPQSSLALDNVTTLFCEKEIELIRISRTTIATTLEETTTEEIITTTEMTTELLTTEATTEATTEMTTELTTTEATTEATTVATTEMTTTEATTEMTTMEATTEMTTTEATTEATTTEMTTTEATNEATTMATTEYTTELTSMVETTTEPTTTLLTTVELQTSESPTESTTVTVMTSDSVTEAVTGPQISTQSITKGVTTDSTTEQIMSTTLPHKNMQTSEATTESVPENDVTLHTAIKEAITEVTTGQEYEVTSAKLTTEQGETSHMLEMSTESVVNDYKTSSSLSKTPIVKETTDAMIDHAGTPQSVTSVEDDTLTSVHTQFGINETETTLVINTSTVTEGVTGEGDTMTPLVIDVTAKIEGSGDTPRSMTTSFGDTELSQTERQSTAMVYEESVSTVATSADGTDYGMTPTTEIAQGTVVHGRQTDDMGMTTTAMQEEDAAGTTDEMLLSSVSSTSTPMVGQPARGPSAATPELEQNTVKDDIGMPTVLLEMNDKTTESMIHDATMAGSTDGGEVTKDMFESTTEEIGLEAKTKPDVAATVGVVLEPELEGEQEGPPKQQTTEASVTETTESLLTTTVVEDDTRGTVTDRGPSFDTSPQPPSATQATPQGTTESIKDQTNATVTAEPETKAPVTSSSLAPKTPTIPAAQGTPVIPTFEIVDMFTTLPVMNTTGDPRLRSTRSMLTTTLGVATRVEGIREIAGFPVESNTRAMSVRFGFQGRIKILIPDIRFNQAGKVEEFQMLIGVWGPFAVQIWREVGPLQDVMGDFNTTGAKVVIKQYQLIYSYNVAPTVGSTTINTNSLCVAARQGDYIGIMFPDTIVPVTYKFMKDHPTPLAFTTLGAGSPVPPIASMLDFEVMMFPWHFNLMAVYDITERC